MTVGFGLLGDIETWVNGQPVDIGHFRQRSVLAALLVDANRSVPADRLVDRIWGDRPPQRAHGTLYGYLSHLRKVLRACANVSILRNAAGYVLSVDPNLVDLHRFRHLISQAGKGTDDEQRLGLYDQALALWRSEPFGRLDNPWFNGLRDTLEKERLAVEVERNDILLRSGRHRGLLPELAERAAAYPLDERLAQQLMLALYRSDRQAQALHQYQLIRQQLAEELGTDPCAALQRLHQQILTADPALLEPTPTPPAPAVTTTTATTTTPVPVPRQLPALPRGFVGRVAELQELTSRLLSESPHGLPVSTISGTGGVGKTWLALRWAHDQLEQFPDGQLYVNLHGFDTAVTPVAPSVALRALLDAMGVDRGSVPGSLDARAGLFRSLVAGKRLLILLDNARDCAQVEPLLPGGPSSTVLVTSRNRLTGLSIRHGARPLPLELLTDDEARDLLTQRLGGRRIEAEPGATAELLDTCGGLPLALGIVAARATTYPCLPLVAMAEELREATARLDDDDPDASPRAVFATSYAALSPKQATAIGLLGIAPGPDISLPAAASLIGTGVPATRGLLHGLEELSLVQQYVAGRFRMHDLVRPYAAERARTDLGAGRRESALKRLLDSYLRTAYAGDQLLQPHSPTFELDQPVPGSVPVPLANQADTVAWFKLEHRSLLAIQATAAERGWYLSVWQLARALSHFHRWHGLHHDDLAVWRAGLVAANQLDDIGLQAEAHRCLAVRCTNLGEHALASDHIRRSTELFEAIGDAYGQAHLQQTRASICEERGDLRTGIAHGLRAMRLFEAVGDKQGQAGTLNMIGWYHALLDEFELGRPLCEDALARYEAYGDELGQANTLDSLGYIAHGLGDYGRALHYYQRSLELIRKLGHRNDEAATLAKLGATQHAQGQHVAARLAWRLALEIYRAQRLDDECRAIQAKLDSLGSLDGRVAETALN